MVAQALNALDSPSDGIKTIALIKVISPKVMVATAIAKQGVDDN